MMALARRIGRDKAHAMVLQIARECHRDKAMFREVVAAHPEVRRLLRPREIERALDYRSSLGLTGFFVDEVLKAHERERGER
jgi:adenylosuccinate lyase